MTYSQEKRFGTCCYRPLTIPVQYQLKPLCATVTRENLARCLEIRRSQTTGWVWLQTKHTEAGGQNLYMVL